MRAAWSWCTSLMEAASTCRRGTGGSDDAFRRRSQASLVAGARSMVPLMAVRLVAATAFAVAFCWHTFCHTSDCSAGADPTRAFSEERLRWVLAAFHLAAAVGADEHAVFSVLAHRPLAMRLLVPGSPVTPLLPGLPTRQSVAGSLLYAAFVCLCARCVWAGTAHSVTELSAACGLFLAACVFDLGLFISSRPADILKFLVALTWLGEQHGGRAACLLLVGCLYFWSGLAKVRAYFWDSVFPHQFLLPNPVLFFARSLYLSDRGATTLCRLFGLAGAVGEAAVGLGIIFGDSRGVVQLGALCAATAMHTFIFICGIGPYRWNVMHLFLAWGSYWHHTTDTQPPQPDALAWVYIVATSVLVPSLGVISPVLLGRYCGGYRQATFHFAGNEMVHGFFIKRQLLAQAQAGSKHSHSHGAYPYILRPLLEQRLPAAPQSFSDDDEYLRFPFLCDGFNVDAAARQALCEVSGCASFEQARADYVFCTLNWLNMHGALLCTKWDESVAPITSRYFKLIEEELDLKASPSEADVVVVTVYPISLFATKKAWDMRTFGAKTAAFEGVVAAAWWPPQACEDDVAAAKGR